MNPKTIASMAAISIVAFVFLLITTVFAGLGTMLFAIIGDSSVYQILFYVTCVSGGLMIPALLTNIISTTLLVTYR